MFGYYNTVEVMALATVTAARVNSQAFSGIMWGGTAASLCFLIFRVFVRLRYFRILYADDFFVLTAWIMLLANSITWQTQQAALYDSFKLSEGQLQPTADILAAEQSLLRANLAVLILFLFCLWSVKISLLVFFRRLGHQVRGQKIWWWFVVGSTILTWAICISVLPYWCLLGSADYILTQCGASYQQSFTRDTFHYQTAADVVTDAMILSIPILMMWNVRIAWGRKLALMGLFSLTIIAIIVSILRVTLVSSSKHQLDTTWLYMWSNIDMAVAIIVACLASFRQLFVMSEKSGPKRQGESLQASGSGFLACFRPFKSQTISGKRSFTSQESDIEQGPISSQTSTNRRMPIDAIHVQRDVNIISGDERHHTQESKVHLHDPWSLPPPGVRYTLQSK